MKGVFETQEMHSPALESTRWETRLGAPLSVYLPPGYAEGKRALPHRLFPHAFSNSGESWTNSRRSR